MKSYFIVCVCMVSCFFADVAFASDIPTRIDYHGYVKSGGSEFNGTGSFKFSIVDDPDNPTTNYWTNDGSSVSAGAAPTAAVSVTVTSGVFNVVLGDTSITNMTAISPSVFNDNSTTYLRVRFNDGVSGFERLTPDKQIVSVPYAYQAYSADNIAGVSGSVVGTSDTQTLTNKTITGATLTTPTTGGAWSLNSDLNFDSNTLVVDQSDNRVGIGTTTPTNTFQVADLINFGNNATTRLTALGYQAGNSVESGGSNNVLLGYQTGNSITTGDANTAIGAGALGTVTAISFCTAVGFNTLAANTSGICTAVGCNALDANTEGSGNTAIGYNALSVNTDQDNNTAIGDSALNALLTTGDCTAVGYRALNANTSGTGATAVGSGALDENTEGNFNTAVGYNALGANDTGADNTAFGYGALDSNTGDANCNTAVGGATLGANTNGDHNTAIGYQALNLLNNTGASRNTAIGALAMDAATNALYNTAVGYNALGAAMVTSDYNIAMGYMAGDNITTGDRNIIIGSEMDAPSATGDSQLNIGGSIYGDISNDYIGIGDFSSAVPTDVMFNIKQTGTVPHIHLNPIASDPTTGADEGDIFMKDTGILYVRSNSDWAACNAAADFSELIFSSGTEEEVPDGVKLYEGEIEAGDVIVINENGNYERSSKPYDSTIVGAESGSRGRFLLDEGTPERMKGHRQIGIVGHILVNVTTENGTIMPGDTLTTSSVPGHAMKATAPGVIVGRALEKFDGSENETDMIEVIVNPGWYGAV